MRMWTLYGEGLVLREYDGIWIVYQVEAGKTHFLNEGSISILDTLKERACSIPEICHRLRGEGSGAPGDPEIEWARSHVERLDALGLIRRVDSAVMP